MFDRVVMVDWSASSVPTPARKDTIWMGETHRGHELSPEPYPTRRRAEAAIVRRIDAALQAGERILIGFDFAFGYPTGFAERVCGNPTAFALWDWVEAHLDDDDRNRNNRFVLADRVNSLFPAGSGPFWGRPASQPFAHLSTRKDRDMGRSGLAEHRQVERWLRGAKGPGRAVKSVWQLSYSGSVGGQVLTGLPVLARIRRQFGAAVSVWPFQTPDAAVVIAEIYPALIDDAVRTSDLHKVRDARQVALMARAFAKADTKAMFGLPEALPVSAAFGVTSEEGWILGAGHHGTLAAAAR